MHRFGPLLLGLLGLIGIAGCTHASNPSAEFLNSGLVVNPADKTEQRKRPLTMTKEKFKTREVLVKFKPGTSKAVMEQIAKHYKLEIIKMVSAPYLYLYEITGNESVQDVITALKESDTIEYSEPNAIYELM